MYLSKVCVAILSSIGAIAFKVGVMVGETDAGFDRSVWLGGEGTGGMRIILDHDTRVVMPPMEGEAQLGRGNTFKRPLKTEVAAASIRF